MDTQTKHTRKQYMNGEVSHADYYSQFVTPEVTQLVLDKITLSEIERSQDEHFNDIPLAAWDSIALSGLRYNPRSTQYVTRDILRDGSDNSLATAVCILKQAARLIKQKETLRG